MLSEIIEKYQESNEYHMSEIIKEFTDLIWNSKYGFKTYKKYHIYKVNEDLLNNRNDLIQLFNKYKIIEYMVCRSFYDTELNPVDYIRIHINNMYGYLTSKDIYLSKEYYKLLLTPKHKYFATIDKIKNGEEINCDEIQIEIATALNEVEVIKEKSNNKKLDLKWLDYKKLINMYIERLFNNYIPPHEYEKKNGWEMHVNVDGWSEDNYIVKYFCKSLTGYLRNYVRNSKPKEVKKKKCIKCGTPIDNTNNKKKYCLTCAKFIKNEQNKKYYHLGK